ncbi:MAG: DMT family transporter [Rhizobiales bacterium]|nr:DMT family transporter [Hyphomicrobiales bacterium]
MNRTALGMIYGLLGGLSLSLGGPIVRMLSEDTNSWQFLAWRSYAFMIFMFAIAIWRAGTLRAVATETGKIGHMLLPIACLVGFGQICYVLGLIHTTVANVGFIIGAGPVFTAFVAWIVLKERLKTSGTIALAAACIGIAIMFKDGLAGEGMLGNLFALGAMVTYSFYVILLRITRDIDTFVASGFGGLIATVAAAWLAGGHLQIPLPDVALAIASGTIQVGFGFAFLTLASKLIPAAQVTLLVLTETVLGPLWVWLLINEVPSVSALIGGVVILSSVAAFAGISLVDERHRTRER